MSTKTTFKRVALVAVASLGLGVLTSVAPANAAALTSATAAQTTTVLPATSSTIASVVFAGFVDNTADTIAVSAPTGPTGGTITFATVGGGAVVTTSAADVVTVGTAGSLAETSDGFGLAAVAATAKAVVATVSLPGTYTFTLGGSGTITIVARSLAFKTGDGAAVAPFSAGNGIAGPANTVTVTARPTGVSSARALVTVTGSTLASGTNSAVIATGGASAVIANSGATDLVIPTPAVGTITVSLFNETGSATGIYGTTAANTVTITVGAAAINGIVVAANSTSFIGATTTEATTDATVTAAATASTAVAANITVVLKDALTNTNSSAFLTASISGPGVVGIVAARSDVLGAAGTNNVYGKSVTGATTANRIVNVYADGTAGVATITISSGTTVIATETVTFTGSAATYTPTQTRKVYAITASAPTTPGDQTITVAVKDSAGNNVANGTTVNATSGSTTVATITASATTTSGVATFTITGLTAGTSVITFANATSSATVTATTTITVGSATIAAVVLTTDKTSYLPGEKVTLTAVATSSTGLPVADGVYTVFSTAPTSSMALAAGTLPAAGAITVGGVAGGVTATLNAPLSDGTFTISGKDNLTALNVVSVTAVVEDQSALAAVDAAAEATDAANAATDAANAAAEAADAATAAAQDATDAVAALSTQVAEMIGALKKQITALTNLVIKIQKKVKA